jgi:uncharacterized phiE125 gp8 family phage protein
MIESEAYAVSTAAMADARAFCRIDGAGEDAVLEPLIAAGLEACERYIGVPPVVRSYRERLAMLGRWQRLGVYPVRAITGVNAVEDGVVGAALAGTAYETDIDACDRGRVRVIVPPGAPGIEVIFSAGLASDWAGCPGSLRFGILHWVAAAMAVRAGNDLPERATALWRPYRAMRLA